MTITCPECKQQVDLTAYPSIEPDQMIECNTCGISLLVTSVSDDKETAQVEIAEEGK